VGLLAAQAPAQDTPVLKTPSDRTSYAIGVDVARNFRRQGLEVDLDLVIKGFKDGFTGEKLLLPELQFRELLSTVQNDLRKKQGPFKGKSVAQANKLRGEDFLAENKSKPGIETLPKGLQYQILKAGEGKKPEATDVVQCYYRGTRLDGTEFICSNPGRPATFKVEEADIPGWREALPLMPVGSRWKLFIPSQLAYGERGVGRDLGPNETIISELELVAIE